MKLLTLLAAASVVFAVPTPQDLPPHIPPDELIWPAATYRYWVKTGKTEFDPRKGLVQKNGNPDEEITTLVNFEFPAETEGKTCILLFDLWRRDTSTGSQRADVFTSLAPQGFSIASDGPWPLGNNRDRHVGRIHATVPGRAEWEESYHGFPKFPCPAGRLLGGEFVGVGDRDKIVWDVGVTGPRIYVL